MVMFEIILRAITGLDTSAFIGPTLAAAGLTRLIALIKPKKVESIAENLENNHLLVDAYDSGVINVVWTLILLGLLVWYWTCYIALKQPDRTMIGVQFSLLIGSINFLVAIIMTGIKGR